MLTKLIISTSLVLAGALAYADKTTTPQAATSKVSSFTSKQQQDIGIIVRQYLLEHPDVLMEVAQKLKMKQMNTVQKDTIEKIADNLPELINSKSPSAGNPKGQVYLVEFFDFQCGHCKHMDEVVKKLMGANKNLKVVYKNFAVLGPNSTLAARFALAAGMQNKYNEAHQILMKSNSKTKETLMEEAKKMGLNVNKLETDMSSDSVTNELNDNSNLAKKLGIQGTPAFIVMTQSPGKRGKVFYVPGSTPQETLQDYISKAAS